MRFNVAFAKHKKAAGKGSFDYDEYRVSVGTDRRLTDEEKRFISNAITVAAAKALYELHTCGGFPSGRQGTEDA